MRVEVRDTEEIWVKMKSTIEGSKLCVLKKKDIGRSAIACVGLFLYC